MNQPGVDPITLSLDGPAPELRISGDMARRGLLVAPVIVLVVGLIWGWAGVTSALFGLALVLGNFLLSAALIAVTARISVGLMMGAILFGYLIRLGIIFAAVWIVKDEAWISIPALAATIIVAYLGLLVWELKHVSISLSHSGLKADRPGRLDTEQITTTNHTGMNHSGSNHSDSSTTT
jgi:hypothetical protein